MRITKLDERIGFADQPTFQELRTANKMGFRTVVNVRLPDEQPEDEAPKAERAGLHYVSLPVAQREWSVDSFTRLAALLEDAHRSPMLVHSADGARAGVLALTVLAARHGWSDADLATQAAALGLELPAEAHEFLRRRAGVPRPR